MANGDQSPCGSTAKRLEDILEEHKAVFEEGLGTYSGPHVSIRVKPDAVPKFCKVRPDPYAQRQAVEEEPARLERQGIKEPVQHSEWASPVVTVLKADGSIRSISLIRSASSWCSSAVSSKSSLVRWSTIRPLFSAAEDSQSGSPSGVDSSFFVHGVRIDAVQSWRHGNGIWLQL